MGGVHGSSKMIKYQHSCSQVNSLAFHRTQLKFSCENRYYLGLKAIKAKTINDSDKLILEASARLKNCFPYYNNLHLKNTKTDIISLCLGVSIEQRPNSPNSLIKVDSINHLKNDEIHRDQVADVSLSS